MVLSSSWRLTGAALTLSALPAGMAAAEEVLGPDGFVNYIKDLSSNEVVAECRDIANEAIAFEGENLTLNQQMLKRHAIYIGCLSIASEHHENIAEEFGVAVQTLHEDVVRYATDNEMELAESLETNVFNPIYVQDFIDVALAADMRSTFVDIYDPHSVIGITTGHFRKLLYHVNPEYYEYAAQVAFSRNEHDDQLEICTDNEFGNTGLCGKTNASLSPVHRPSHTTYTYG